MNKNWLFVTIGGVLATLLLGAVIYSDNADAKDASWTGCGVGVIGSYHSTTNDTDINVTGVGSIVSIDGLGSNGVGFGLHGNCGVQLDQMYVGGFADYSGLDQDFSVTSPFVTGDIVNVNYDSTWTIGGKLGWLPTQKVLVYGLVGYSGMSGDVSLLSGLGGPTASMDWTGWTFGAGIETKITDNVHLALEYRDTRYDSEPWNVAPGFVSVDFEPHTQVGMARLTYQFDFARDVAGLK